MEKEGYRATLAMLWDKFGKAALSVDETAEALGVNRKTVYAAIKRRFNPLPSQKITSKRIVIPLSGLARWMCC